MDATPSASEAPSAYPPSLLLLLPVLLSIVWIIFQLFYVPWLLAVVITKLANVWLSDSGIYIGSIHINFLSGRVVFKQLHYYCRDYSIRVNNGYASVSWCRTACCRITPGSVKKTSFLFFVLDGVEYHWYNRSDVYDSYGLLKETHSAVTTEEGESGFWLWWKENQPSLHFTINKGRVLMGNHHLERSLLFRFERGEAHYSTEQASTEYDELMHSVNLKCSSVGVFLDKSHGYCGPTTEQPPVTFETTDESYLLLKSDWAHFVFSQDSPGLVPLGQTPPPKYACDVTLGTNTIVNYGCYANRLRRELQSFFFPVDHVEQAVSHVPQAGERRVHSMFDISVSLSSPAKFNVLFSFQQSLHRLRLWLGSGSQLSIHVPWLTGAEGSTSVVKGQLVDISVKSSLPYQRLGTAASISFLADLQFPRLWNAVQKWRMKFSGNGVQANILFAYIDFINALLDDWLGLEPSDLMNFVPVDWTIDIDLTQYEIFLFTNRYNWLDLLEGDVENTRLAFCGSKGHISFRFPFTEFNPPKQFVHFLVKGEDIVVRHYAPPSCASREGIFAISSANRYRWRLLEPSAPVQDSLAKDNAKANSSNADSFGSSRPAVSLLSSESVTVEKEQTQLLSSVGSQEHVITAPVIGGVVSDRLGMLERHEAEKEASKPPTPTSPGHTTTQDDHMRLVDKERFPMGYCDVTRYEKGWLDLACGPTITINIEYTSHNHDPSPGQHTPLLPNMLHVDIDAPVVLLRVFGCLARDLLGLKENYPGEYIKMSPFSSNSYSPPATSALHTPHLKEAPPPEPHHEPHPPQERTIDIFVSFKLRNITAEFPTDLSKDAPRDFPLPSLCTNLLGVEVTYVASETKVQLHVDPLSVHVPSLGSSSSPTMPPPHHNLGHVVINSIDFNCHGLTEYMCQERVEYAWMMQLLVGRITGAVSPLQLLIAADWCYTTFIHSLSLGDEFEVAPDGELICPRIEPISEEIKYRLFDLDIAEADVYICETAGLTRLQSAGLDLQMCTFHQNDQTMGISWQLRSLTVTGLLPDPQEPSLQLQVGVADVNTVQGNVTLQEPLDCVPQRQFDFLCKADKRTQRLWFLWREECFTRCGCCGGCLFMNGFIAWKNPVPRSESAVYRPQFAPLTSFPRHLGFEGLDQVLRSSSIVKVECVQSLHRGLLEHYQARYASTIPVHHMHVTPEDRVSRTLSSRPVSNSDDASFVSAHSSLTSLLEEYRSHEVNLEATLSPQSHHKRKPSHLTTDVRANQVDADDTDILHSGYHGVMDSQILHSVTLRVPPPTVGGEAPQDSLPPNRSCGAESSTAGPHLCQTASSESNTTYKVHHRQSASDTSFMMRASPDTGHNTAPFHVYVPCLTPPVNGCLPLIKQVSKTHTLERKRKIFFKQQELDDKPTAKISLSVQFSASNRLLLAPPFLKIISSATKSVESFFSARSPVSILNWCGFPASYTVIDALTQLVSPTPIPISSETPLLHANLLMPPGSFLAFQLLQSSPSVSVTLPELSQERLLPGQLTEIRGHRSLLTVYASGAAANLLLQNSPTSEAAHAQHAVSGKTIKFSAEIKFPVVQANMSVLFEGEASAANLPGLAPAQQQLDFNLFVPPLDAQSPDLVVLDLLEAGLKDVSLSMTACILHSETTSDPILTWESLQTASPRQQMASSQCQDVQNNQLYLKVEVPVLWCQLASPPCGLPDPAAGGLDILLLQDVVKAWHEPVQTLQGDLAQLASTKERRDKQVLLTAFANAVRNGSLLDKPFNPVVAKVAVQYRDSVVYCCLYQTWRALPVFSEVHVPSTSPSPEADVQLMALILALAAKIQFVCEDGYVRSDSPALPVDRASVGTGGYISISPSPSDMALPNRLYASAHAEDLAMFSQLDYDTLLVLRESLIPLFFAAGVSVDRQLLLPHLNTAKIAVDFTVHMKEAAVFVLDHVVRGTGASPGHTYSTTPTLLAEQLFFNGSLKQVQEDTASHPKALLLLAGNSRSQSTVAMASNCCASLETLHLTVTAALLKLSKHVSVTGRLRRKALKQARLEKLDEMETPCPPAAPAAEGVEGVIKFAASIVSHLADMQSEALPPQVTLHSTSTASTPKLVELGDSPKVARKKATSLPVYTSVSMSTHLGVPEGSVPVTSSRSDKSSRPETQTSSSEQESQPIVITMEPDGTSPEDVLSTMDTCGDDTTDSQHVVSSDNEGLFVSAARDRRASVQPSTASPVVPEASDHTLSLRKGLSLPESQLQFSIFCLLKLHTVKCEFQIESTRAVLELMGVSAAVDTRNSSSAAVPSNATLPLLSEVLPTYLSIAAILKKSMIRVTDRGLPDSDLLLLTVLPMYASFAISNNPPISPNYRCLLKLTSLQVDIRQSVIKIHNRFQQLMPAFTRTYRQIFGEEIKSVPESYFATPQSSSTQQVLSVESVIKLPSKLPQGFVHFSLDKTTVYVAPLPSLTVTYTVTPVSIKAQTAHTLTFQLLIGDHVLRFNPKEQHKDELSLRFLALPRLHLQGKVSKPKKNFLPKVTLDLSIKQLNIDVTTDVLNQLLIVQNTFIKELNDLVQMLTSMGESLPSRERLATIRQRSEEGLDLVSLLESCRLSLAGIVVTVSTPLATAIRFATGKIEMTVSSQQWPWKTTPTLVKNQLSLDGRVEIDVNLALGYLQDVGPDVVDDLRELAYFKTRISIRNTLQNLPGGTESVEGEPATAVDTFVISIISPHLYLQSSAVEQAILFWLNCKSVYSYWQNERKLLNVEIRKATDAFIEKINRPAHFQTPSIDFSRPRLVQISVSDVGACMPIIPVTSAHHTAKPFPALVVTIKDMHFLLNLSHKVASTGRFQTFCIRFAEQFSTRHKIWTLDPKRHKLTNFGTIIRGTFRLCIASKKRYCDRDPSIVVGEKLLCGFQWDMSGIDVHANTDIGHHTSTLVRTLVTSITSDMEGLEKQRTHRSSMSSPKSQSVRHVRKVTGASKGIHKRSMSVYQRPSQADSNYKVVLEQQLAKQTRRVQQLRYTGATADSLRMEEAILRSTEQELAKTVQRMFRHPRAGLTLQTFNQLFSPRPVSSSLEREKTGSVHRLSTAVRSKLFSLSDSRDKDSNLSSPVHASGGKPSLGHRRYKSDLTGLRPDAPAPQERQHNASEELAEEKEDIFEEAETFGEELEASPAKEAELMEGFSLPSIDLEFDVTLNVDHGKIVLWTEESSPEQNLSHSTLITQSPLLQMRKSKSDLKHSVESVLLIPALTVKTHYQSIVGPTYSHPSASPSHQASPSPGKLEPPQPVPHFPVKRGVLSLSVIIESLPDDIRLTHGFLEFIEQVARPTLAATVVSSSSSTESLDQETESSTEDKTNQALTISFPVDVTLTFHIQPSTVYLTCQPHSHVECIIQSPDVNFVVSFSLFSQQLREGSSLGSSSPAGSLSGPNPNVVPFNNLFITGCLTTFVLQLYCRKPGGVASDNKEALSLTLGQALVHLSRKSVSAPSLPRGSQKLAASVDDYNTSHNKMQVSVITNVASLVLGYDMRRLNDITAFKRYWYRTSLVEALFIGSKKDEEPTPSSLGVEDGVGKEDAGSAVLDSTVSAAIVVAASIDDFRVSANVAQVMGNADLLVSCLKCEAHCDVSRNELVLLQLRAKLDKGEFDARGGIVAGSILMEDASVEVMTQSSHGSIPEHKGRATLPLVEGRVDYMSACILLTRATQLEVEVYDVWQGLHLGVAEVESVSEEACIQVEAHFTWQDMQLAIHRSTTQHFINIVEKLYDFVMQQKRRSERTLSSMLPAGSAASKALKAYREEQQRMAEKESSAVSEDSKHHWLWAVKVGGKELMRILGIQPPKDAEHEVSLGGHIRMAGQCVCIVCFHGSSFREIERAVFSIDQVAASFSTQAIPGLLSHWRSESPGLHTHLRTCQQIVELRLGEEGDVAYTRELASVHRVSSGRSRVPNISGVSIKDWLVYACIDTFLHEEKYTSDTSTLVRLSRKLSIQPVILVPAFHIKLINDHSWPLKNIASLLPRVECTLTSSFSDGISVTTTVDHYLFLHDLVRGYIDYLQKHRIKLSEQPPDSPTASPAPLFPQKRQFECVHWELNPDLRLLSTVSGQFNPRISWLLERLGFSDARTTIPKWIQRGAMDPLDKVVAIAVELLVKLTASKKEKLIFQSTVTSPVHH